MARRSREDVPGSWHHVFNRGLARRTVFELLSDIRYFQSRLAREVRAGTIEVHAYCFLTTHFHLLVRSLRGELSQALARIQNAFVRRFNRQRKRDGSLFRGRFGSVPVQSDAYWQDLLIYIEGNAARAGLVGDPRLFPHCSASRYAGGGGPIWLTRGVVESLVLAHTGFAAFSPDAYRRFLDTSATADQFELIERRMSARSRGPDPLDDLIRATSPEVLDWMRRKARVADGTNPGLPVLSAGAVGDIIQADRLADPDWSVSTSQKRHPGWALLHAGLLRDAAGLTFAEIGQRLNRSDTGSRKLVLMHRELLEADQTYAARAARVLEQGLRRGRIVWSTDV